MRHVKEADTFGNRSFKRNVAAKLTHQNRPLALADVPARVVLGLANDEGCKGFATKAHAGQNTGRENELLGMSSG